MFLMEMFLTEAEIIGGKFRGLDSELGLTYIPNKETLKFSEGFSFGNTNDFGYLDAMGDKRSDEIRIALVGDSYVVGQEIMKRNHFSTKLKNEIEKVTDKVVRIMNFGMMEYDFCDAYCRYSILSKKTKPDIVFWLAEEADLNCVDNSGIPDLVLENEELKIDYSFSKSKNFEKVKNRNGFLDQTRFWNLLASCKLLFLKNKSGEILFGKLNKWFSPKELPKKNTETSAPKIDDRVDNILDVLPKQTFLVITKKINFDIKEITKGFDGELFFLDPEFDELRARGEDPHYWKGTKRRGHFNQDCQKIMGERFSEELILAMKKWELL